MNGNQTGFVKFINQMGMVSLGAFVSQVVWVIGSLTFTYLVWWLATHDKAYIELAIALLAAWTGKSITNAAANYGVRTTAREYVEAKAKGEASGTPAVAVTAKDQAKVEVTAPTNGTVTEPPPEEHVWATGDDPRAGIL